MSSSKLYDEAHLNAANARVYSATDKEIFDLLMSSKQRLTSTALHEIARTRGFFFSKDEDRDELASYISLLPHDHHSLQNILDQREPGTRSEKVASEVLRGAAGLSEIREVAKEMELGTIGDDRIAVQTDGPGRCVIDVSYSEVDYGKTRLIQRRQREAKIEISVSGDRTLIRYPATERAERIVSDLREGLRARTKTAIEIERIDLTQVSSPLQKTEFFTKLISGIEGFSVDNVTTVKVESEDRSSSDEDLSLEDEDERDSAQQEMLSVVRKVALSGLGVLSSTEYQSLSRRGFYITHIIWRARNNRSPYDKYELEASFGDNGMKMFRYNVRGVYHRRGTGGDYTKTLRPVTSDNRQELFALIEAAGRRALESLADSTMEAEEAAQ